jgi:hypothetical protein
MGVELSDIFIMLKPHQLWRKARTQAELVRLMEDELAILPGMRSVFSQPIEMRVNEMVAGSRSDVVLSPHLGFVNDPVFSQYGPGVVGNLLAWLRGEPLPHPHTQG